MSNLTVPYVLYQMTGSAVWVGLFALANFLPSMFFAPLGGVLADRYDRRQVLILTQTGAAITAAFLVLEWILGIREPILLLLPVAVSGTFAGINMSSFMAFINDLVPRRQLRAAVTLNSIQFNMARAVGPLAAGALLAIAGPTWALFINFLTYVLVVLALLSISARKPQVLIKDKQHVAKQLGAAIQYMRRSPGIALAMIATIIGGVFGQPIYSLTVVLVRNVYHVDEFKFGVLNAALSIGALLSIPLLAGSSRRFPLSKAISWGMLGGASGLVALSVIDEYYVALPIFVITGAALILVMAGTNTVVQLIVRDDLRGRVLAVRQLFGMGAVPTGALLGGIISDLVGIKPFLMWSGILLLLSLLAMKVLPQRGMLSLDDPHDRGGSDESECGGN